MSVLGAKLQNLKQSAKSMERFGRLLFYFLNFSFFPFFHFSFLNFPQCLSEVIDDVVDVLGTDAQTDGSRRDVLFGQLLLREL